LAPVGQDCGRPPLRCGDPQTCYPPSALPRPLARPAAPPARPRAGRLAADAAHLAAHSDDGGDVADDNGGSSESKCHQ